MASAWYSRRAIRDWLVAGLAIAAFALVTVIVVNRSRETSFRLRITAGSGLELRHHLALLLAREAPRQLVYLSVQESDGSEAALDAVNTGRVELALVQGGLALDDRPNVRVVTPLHVEPLHLLVKDKIYSRVRESLVALRGKTVNLGPHRSGTYELSTEVLRFVGLSAGSAGRKGDYTPTSLTYEQLEQQTNTDRLPDAVFVVSTLPSRIAKHLVTHHHYQLVPLPYGEAFALDAFNSDEPVPETGRGEQRTSVRKLRVSDAVIPAYTYEVEPESIPPESIHTLGTRLLLVAHKDVDPRAIDRLLQLVFSSQIAQLTRPPINPSLLSEPNGLPLHAGTRLFLLHSRPLSAGDMVEVLEKLATIGAPTLGGLLFLWQWARQHYRRRSELSFEHYISRVTEVERQALQLEMSAMLELRALLLLQQTLGRLKSEALAKFVTGELEGKELMSGFLAHVNDARNYLARLILHERENLETEAQAQGRPLRILWLEALSGLTSTDQAAQRPTSSRGEGGHQNLHAPVDNT